jgi:hypothetical protein
VSVYCWIENKLMICKNVRFSVLNLSVGVVSTEELNIFTKNDLHTKTEHIKILFLLMPHGSVTATSYSGKFS